MMGGNPMTKGRAKALAEKQRQLHGDSLTLLDWSVVSSGEVEVLTILTRDEQAPLPDKTAITYRWANTTGNSGIVATRVADFDALADEFAPVIEADVRARSRRRA